jgi:hypothetical protein
MYVRVILDLVGLTVNSQFAITHWPMSRLFAQVMVVVTIQTLVSVQHNIMD